MAKEQDKNLPMTMESQDIFEKFEQLDDKVILAELENQVLDDWVYHFTQDGKDVWGLGKVGIDECTKKMGKLGIALREDSIKFDVDPTHPEFVLFTAHVSKHFVSKGGGEAMIESAIGTKRQWIMMKRKDGKLVHNKFWFEQGSIKALRNAKSRLIPEDIKTKIITFAKQHRKVKKIEPLEKEEPKKAKPEAEKKPAASTGPDFPENREKGAEFPPEAKQEEESTETPTQKDIYELNRLEATLVDKYGFTPDQIIDKLEEKFGQANLSKLSREQAKEAIDYFERTIDFLEQLKKEKQKE